MDSLPLELFINIIKRLHKYDRDNLALSCKQFNKLVKTARNTFICYEKMKSKYTFISEYFIDKTITCDNFYCVLGYIPRELTVIIDNQIYQLVVASNKYSEDIYRILSYRINNEVQTLYTLLRNEYSKGRKYKIDENFTNEIIKSEPYDTYHRPLVLTCFGYNQLIDIMPQIYAIISRVIRSYKDNDWRDPDFLINLLTVYHYDVTQEDMYMIGKNKADYYAIFHNFYFKKRLQTYIIYDTVKSEIIEANKILTEMKLDNKFKINDNIIRNFVLCNRLNKIIEHSGINWRLIHLCNDEFLNFDSNLIHYNYSKNSNIINNIGILIHVQKYVKLSGDFDDQTNALKLSLIYLRFVDPNYFK